MSKFIRLLGGLFFTLLLAQPSVAAPFNPSQLSSCIQLPNGCPDAPEPSPEPTPTPTPSPTPSPTPDDEDQGGDMLPKTPVIPGPASGNSNTPGSGALLASGGCALLSTGPVSTAAELLGIFTLGLWALRARKKW